MSEEKKNYDTITKYEITYIGPKPVKTITNPCIAPGQPQKDIRCPRNEPVFITADHYSELLRMIRKDTANWKHRKFEVGTPDKEINKLNQRLEKIEKPAGKKTTDSAKANPMSCDDSSSPIKPSKKKPRKKSKKKPSKWADGKATGRKEKPGVFPRNRPKLQEQD